MFQINSVGFKSWWNKGKLTVVNQFSCSTLLTENAVHEYLCFARAIFISLYQHHTVYCFHLDTTVYTLHWICWGLSCLLW
jgi:hypothetical protein